jgi:hypothetical protein
LDWYLFLGLFLSYKLISIKRKSAASFVKTALSVEDFNVKNVLLTEDFTENDANPLILTCVMSHQAH